MLKFYYVNEEYIRHLKATDPRVPNISYATNQKFVCGIVFQIQNGLDYYAPVSHNTSVHRTSIIIKSASGRPLSSIRFSYMIPVPDRSLLEELRFSEIAKSNPKYARLLMQEHDFCIRHEADILAKAEKVYRYGCDPNNFYYQFCCNFKQLEGASLLWMSDTAAEKEPLPV